MPPLTPRGQLRALVEAELTTLCATEMRGRKIAPAPVLAAWLRQLAGRLAARAVLVEAPPAAAPSVPTKLRRERLPEDWHGCCADCLRQLVRWGYWPSGQKPRWYCRRCAWQRAKRVAGKAARKTG